MLERVREGGGEGARVGSVWYLAQCRHKRLLIFPALIQSFPQAFILAVRMPIANSRLAIFKL